MARRRSVSSSAFFIESVMRSAYRIARPFRFRAQRRWSGSRILPTAESFFVGVEDSDQGNFGQVEPFAQQVDRSTHRIRHAAGRAGSSRAPGFNLRVHVAALQRPLRHSTRPGLRPSVGESGDEHALVDSERRRISCSRSSIWPFTGRISTGGSSGPSDG